MKHQELVENVANTLRRQGYDVSTEGLKYLWWGTDLKGMEKLVAEGKADDPIVRTWIDLANVFRSTGRGFVDLRPDIIAVKDKDITLVECKASETERFVQQLANMSDMGTKARQKGRAGTKVKVVLALDVDTEGLELWGKNTLADSN